MEHIKVTGKALYEGYRKRCEEKVCGGFCFPWKYLTLSQQNVWNDLAKNLYVHRDLDLFDF